MSRLPPISSLMSPPEAELLEHFDPSIAPTSSSNDACLAREASKIGKHHPKNLGMGILPSPPDSPWQKHDHTTAHEQNGTSENTIVSHKDPILYPNETDNAVDGALFGDILNEDPRRKLVEEHMRHHYVVPKSRGTKAARYQMPTEDEYLLVVSCVSKVRQVYNQDPGAYLKRTRDECDEGIKFAKRMRLTSVRDRPTVRLEREDYQSPKQTSSSKKAIVRSSGPLSRKTQSGSTTPGTKRDTTPARRAPPAKKQEPPNFNFNEIPDYSPALSTLPSHPKSLAVDWQGNALDLSMDPNRNLLHEAEVYLASKLRLTCASYLCVKRRIFVGRVNCFIKGKKFTKTDAQSCGHIDVNKSSKIWTAYEKVGWLDRHHFEQAIATVRQSPQCYDPSQQCMVETAKYFGWI